MVLKALGSWKFHLFCTASHFSTRTIYENWPAAVLTESLTSDILLVFFGFGQWIKKSMPCNLSFIISNELYLVKRLRSSAFKQCKSIYVVKWPEKVTSFHFWTNFDVGLSNVFFDFHHKPSKKNSYQLSIEICSRVYVFWMFFIFNKKTYFHGNVGAKKSLSCILTN